MAGVRTDVQAALILPPKVGGLGGLGKQGVLEFRDVGRVVLLGQDLVQLFHSLMMGLTQLLGVEREMQIV